MSFFSVAIDLATSADAERVEAACFAAGALSVTLTDQRDDPVLEPAPGELRLWPATRMSALFAAEAAGAELLATLSAELGMDPGLITVRAVADRAWEREWLADFHAMRFGRRLWIAPSHEPVSEPGAVVVQLDPGLAFGTGTHPTTAMCLEWLDAHLRPGARMIDYGCGSGILAVAALRLGAARAAGWDIDPQALTATRENAQRNAVAERLEIPASEDRIGGEADVLIANILAGPLVTLAPRFAALVRAGGSLVLSGLLEASAGEVACACAPWFDTDRFGSREGWVCLAGVRRVHDLP